MPPPPPARTRWLLAAVYAGFWSLLGLAFAGQSFLVQARRGLSGNWGQTLAGSLADWYLFGVLALPAISLSRRFHLGGRDWTLRLTLHAVASTVFALLWILVRAVVEPWLPGRTSARPFAEVLSYVIAATFSFNVLVYWMVLTATHAVAYARNLRERERRVLDLERRLATARLDALQMQLNPHFLFNALQGISTLMYRDVETADAMLIRLSQLLRHALDRSGEQLVPLRDDLEFLGRYLTLETMRFGHRLQVDVQTPDDCLDTLVPNLLLQPLVENALKYGIEPRPQGGRLVIRAARQPDGRLRIEVGDDGAGFDSSNPPAEGIGLSNTRARLRQVYGGRASLQIESQPGRGTRIFLTVPDLRAPSTANS